MMLIGSIPVAAACGVLTIGQLLAVGFATGVATVLFQVAYQSYLPTIVAAEDLAEGNAKLQGTQAAAGVAGPGIGGLLVQSFRAPFALVLDSVSYLVSVLALLAITAREAPTEPRAERSLRAEIVEGARYVRADPLLRTLTIAPADCPHRNSLGSPNVRRWISMSLASSESGWWEGGLQCATAGHSFQGVCAISSLWPISR